MPLNDDPRFGGHMAGLSSPAANALAIAPNDAADLTEKPRALFCTAVTGGSLVGTIRVTMLENGAIVTLPIVPGAPLPVRVSRVWATGTTVTGIVGVW